MSTTEDHKEKNAYELGYLILPSIVEDDLSSVVDTIKGIIKKFGGEETASENPIKIDLAYTMSKTIGARKYVADEAYIGWVKFLVSGTSAPEISEAMKKLDEVLRFLLIKNPKDTGFTFAKALEAKEKKIRELEEEKNAVSEPLDPVDSKIEKVIE